MKVLDAGHRYVLEGNKGTDAQEVTFYKDEKINGDGYGGTTLQEFLRVLIDRAFFLDGQVPGGGVLSMVPVWQGQIIELEVRAAGRHGLCMFEARRQLTRLAEWSDLEKVEPRPEDGHIYPQEIHTAAWCGGRCDGKGGIQP